MAEEKVFTENDRPENIEGEFVIPEGFTEIGGEAFCECASLTSIIIPNSVTKIGYSAFEGCTNLKSIEIPNSVTEIEGEAFKSCSSLTSVVIPDSVTEIGSSAFSYCSSLTSVVIPDSVTEIGKYAFSYCSSLTSVVIPNSVTEVRESAFEGCSSLTSVVIPDSVTEVGESAFYGCTSLTSVVIPDSVTEIGEIAFSGCTSLASVVIPDSGIKIGADAFVRTPYAEEMSGVSKFNIEVYGYSRSFTYNFALWGKLLGKDFDFCSKISGLSNAEKHNRIEDWDLFGDKQSTKDCMLNWISVADEDDFGIMVKDSSGNTIYDEFGSEKVKSHIVNSQNIAEDIIWDFGYDPHSEDILFFSDFSDLEFIKNFLPASMCSADVLEFVSKAMCEYAEECGIDIDSDEVTCEEALTLLTYAVELLFAKQNSSLLTLSALIDCPGIASFESRKGSCEFNLELPKGENFDPSKLKLFKFYKEDWGSPSQGVVDESYDTYSVVKSHIIYGDTLLEGEEMNYRSYGSDLVDIDSEGVFTCIPYEYEEEDDDDLDWDNEEDTDEVTDSSNDHIAFFNSFKSAVDFGDKLKVNKPSKNEVGITCPEMGKIKLVSKRTKNDLCVIVYSYDEKERMERIHSSKNAEIESALSSFGELSYTATDKSVAFSIKKPLSDFADDNAHFEWIKNVALTFRDLFVKYVAL